MGILVIFAVVTVLALGILGLTHRRILRWMTRWPGEQRR